MSGSLTPLVSALGVAQIISWGTLFYAIGVLGTPMRNELGVSDLFLFGSFTAGLFVSGTLAPLTGRLIDKRGGRFVLSCGSVVGAIAMAMLAAAVHPAMMVAGWLIAGVAMSMCLYDPAFAIFGGFASTAFWPLSHLLLEGWGWRTGFAVYAAMHLMICLPIHQVFVPRHSHIMKTETAQAAKPVESPGLKDPRLLWLTVSFALATFIFGVIAVHLISLLTSAGLTAAQAVTISMLVGPMQVAGRVIELSFSNRVRAVTVGLVSFALMMLALVALISVEGFGIAAIVFVIAYGCGNGILTIVKGTAPVELFGRQGLGALLGYLSRAGFCAKAIAPAAFSALLTFGLTRNTALSALVLLALAGCASYALAIRRQP
jgi:hypothetical protein